MKGKGITWRVLMLAFRRYWRRIIGTCACWFCEHTDGACCVGMLTATSVRFLQLSLRSFQLYHRGTTQPW